jgi:hypothetical protein
LITLSDSIEVEAAPGEVFQWLVEHMSDRKSYQAWHPDHADIRWIKGEPVKEGSIVCADEYLHGVLHRLKFRIVKVVPNNRIEYRALFPLSLLAPGNMFLIEPKCDGGCIFTAKGGLRLPRWIFERLAKGHKGKIEATRQHMKEEGRNLKEALEGRTGRPKDHFQETMEQE